MFGDKALKRSGVEDGGRLEKTFEDILVSQACVNFAQRRIVLFFAEESKDGHKSSGADAGDDVEFWTAAGRVAPAVENAAAEGAVSIPAREYEDISGRTVGK